jgi:carboxyl-terminal processing protease
MGFSRPNPVCVSVGIMIVWLAMAVAQDRVNPEPPDRPATVDGRPVAAVQGVWRSRGYGYVVQIGADGPRLFHIAGDYCYPDPRPQRDPDELFVHYRPLGPDTVAFSATPGQTRYVFDRVASLPLVCADATPWTPPRIAAAVAAIFADVYPSFAERGIDWRARTAKLAGKLDASSDDDDLFDHLKEMLAGVEDPHIELHAEIDGQQRDFEPGEAQTILRVRARSPDDDDAEEKWQSAYRRGILETILRGRGHETANGRVLWGRAGDFGYINLMAMSGFADESKGDMAVVDTALDQAIAAFAGVRAVIVDISNNRGGYDGLGQYIAGRFAEARQLAYTKVGYRAQGVEPQPYYVEPSERTRYTGPIYLLTSDITLSAGETFALFMRALPNVLHVGETTRGAFSDMTDKPLPNKWRLMLPTEIYRDPGGRSYEVRGLPPQIRREVFPASDLNNGHGRRVLAIMDEIRKGEGELSVRRTIRPK